MQSYFVHNKKYQNCKYVYKVISRRVEGVSIGINLGNYCNWKCIYCEVENKALTPNSERINLEQLEEELETTIANSLSKEISESIYELKSITFSGEGEPTISPDFLDVIKVVKKVRNKFSNHLRNVKTVLITNGSNLKSKNIENALDILASINGEIWFKVDRIDQYSRKQINAADIKTSDILDSIKSASAHCKVLIQTCWFHFTKENDLEKAKKDFLEFLKGIKENISGVLLYTVARKCHSDESENIFAFTSFELNIMEEQIKNSGIACKSFS